jgi:signal transduction histidine kinase
VERVHLGDVIRDALGFAEGRRTRDDIRVSLVLPPDLPTLEADPHQLRQIFQNLITNAFEALGAGGTIEIGAFHFRTDDDQSATEPQPTRLIAIDVSDDGPGIAAEMADRIFSPFFTTKPRGTGLGLAIVRKIVDAHDGRIDMMTRPGGGTRFRVTLPVAGAQQQWFN